MRHGRSMSNSMGRVIVHMRDFTLQMGPFFRIRPQRAEYRQNEFRVGSSKLLGGFQVTTQSNSFKPNLSVASVELFVLGLRLRVSGEARRPTGSQTCVVSLNIQPRARHVSQKCDFPILFLHSVRAIKCQFPPQLVTSETQI